MADIEFTVDMPPHLLDQDLKKTLWRALHRHGFDLATMEQSAIRARTPVDTGALFNSETFTVNPNPQADELVFLYADQQEQLDTWNRIYDLYQEGGALGKPTYTNNPQEMFGRVLTDDVPQIEALLSAALQEGLQEYAAGIGVPG
jgi:hypothetical protein